MTFFSLVSTAFSSIFYGFVVTAAVMALLYAVLKAISRGIVQTPVFYATGVVLVVLLLIQTSLMIGAIQARSVTYGAESYLNQLLEDSYGTVGAQDSQRILDKLTDEIPIIGTFVDTADFSGHDVEDLPAAMTQTIREYLTKYIWHRVWWTLAIIAVACVVVICFGRRDNISSSQHCYRSKNVERRRYISTRKRY